MDDAGFGIDESRHSDPDGGGFGKPRPQRVHAPGHFRDDGIGSGKFVRGDGFIFVEDVGSLADSEFHGGPAHVDADDWMRHAGLDGGGGGWSRTGCGKVGGRVPENDP